MSQIVNTNIASLNAQRNLSTSSDSLNVSLRRLSSGLRINSAADDAAGLAISTRFTSSINGLNQAIRNAADAISLSQTTEGALQEYSNILQRMRELSIQSANGTNTAADRSALQSEVNQLLQELTRISTTTTFNGRNVLNGDLVNTAFQIGAEANQTVSVSVDNTQTNAIGANQIRTDNTKGIEAATRTESLAGGFAAGTVGANVGTADTGSNGYLSATYTVRNSETSGSITSNTVATAGAASALSIASSLNSLTGVTATGFNQVTLEPTVGSAFTLGIATGAGQTVTGATADAIATAINANATLRAADVYAVSNGTTLDVFAVTGNDLFIGVTDGTSSVNITSAFNGGNVGTITGTAEQARGGRVDVFLDQGFTLESSRGDDVFAAAADTAFTTTAAGTTDTSAGNSVGAQTLTITGGTGSATVSVAANQSAESIASAVNAVSNLTAVEASATTTARIDSISANGTVSFNLRGDNATAVSIIAAVTTTDLSSLVTSINDASGQTGITASLGDTSASLVMTNSAGANIEIDSFVHTAAVDYQVPSTTAVNGSGSNAPAPVEVNMVITGNPPANTASASQDPGNFGGTSVTLYDGGSRNGQDSTVVGGELVFTSTGTFSVTSNIDGAGNTGQSLFAGTANSSVGSVLSALNTVDIGTEAGAQSAIDVLNQAINTISSIRADLGAVQSRFQSAISNLSNNVENLSVARSRIQDADFAAETAELTRNQILQQAGTSILSQANSLPQNVLALLQ